MCIQTQNKFKVNVLQSKTNKQKTNEHMCPWNSLCMYLYVNWVKTQKTIPVNDTLFAGHAFKCSPQYLTDKAILHLRLLRSAPGGLVAASSYCSKAPKILQLQKEDEFWTMFSFPSLSTMPSTPASRAPASAVLLPQEPLHWRLSLELCAL